MGASSRSLPEEPAWWCKCFLSGAYGYTPPSRERTRTAARPAAPASGEGEDGPSRFRYGSGDARLGSDGLRSGMQAVGSVRRRI
jgi:hypothetical protein